MTPERWRRVKELFDEVLHAEPDAQAALLAGACGGDRELRETVERLLAAHAGAAEFMETSPVQGLAAAIASQGRLTGTIRGGYSLRHRIGAGGTGEVYDGVHIQSGRRAAIKVLSDETPEASKRLSREARHALKR